MSPSKALAAEFVGTFALTLVGGGAIVMTAAMAGGGGGLVAVALAHGLILSVMITATMHISGGQLNPAVSLALAATGRQPWPQATVFIVSQLVGAVAAAFILQAALGSLPAASDPAVMAVDEARLGATLGGMGLDAGRVFLLEVIGTFFLMFVIIGSAVDSRGPLGNQAVGGFAIGMTLAAVILFIGPLTGASVNPARSFGPALIGGHFDMHWAYWAGPIVGAAIAAFGYSALFPASDSDPD